MSYGYRTEAYTVGLWNLNAHLVLDVGERNGEVDGEHDQDHIAFWVAQRPETVVLLLTGRIPERELHELAIKVHERDIVLEHRWDVCLCCA